MVIAFVTWTRLGGGVAVSRVILAALPFDNLGDDSGLE
jgi:hypothetical protein